MKKYFIPFFLIFLILFVSCKENSKEENVSHFYLKKGKYEGEYFPTDGWRECSPEEVGFSSEKLEKVYEYAANPNITTQALILIRKGYIFFELYLNGFSRYSKHWSYSVAKSFTSALVGIACDEGLIKSLDEKIYEYYKSDYNQYFSGDDGDLKRMITIRNLLTMSSGIEWCEEEEGKDDDAFKMMEYEDYLKYVLEKPMRAEPGTYWYYSSGDPMLLSLVLEKATGKKPSEYAKEKLFDRIGMKDVYWAEDGKGHTITAWGIKTTARQFAKFGYLYLKNGKWEDKQIISESWVKHSVLPVSNYYKSLPWVNFYGYLWWLLPALNDYQRYNLPQKTYLAWGLHTQQIFVIPEKELIIVRLGYETDERNDEWKEAEFLSIVMNAML